MDDLKIRLKTVEPTVADMRQYQPAPFPSPFSYSAKSGQVLPSSYQTSLHQTGVPGPRMSPLFLDTDPILIPPSSQNPYPPYQYPSQLPSQLIPPPTQLPSQLIPASSQLLSRQSIPQSSHNQPEAPKMSPILSGGSGSSSSQINQWSDSTVDSLDADKCSQDDLKIQLPFRQQLIDLEQVDSPVLNYPFIFFSFLLHL